MKVHLFDRKTARCSAHGNNLVLTTVREDVTCAACLKKMNAGKA